jgi:hypothetical protein
MAAKRPSAFFQAIQEDKPSQDQVEHPAAIEVEPQSVDKVIPQNLNNVKPQKEERSRVTMYLKPGQEQKLDVLAVEYLKATGKRINRNDIVRWLVEECDTDMLLQLGRKYQG